jgi:hypothetical protein
MMVSVYLKRCALLGLLLGLLSCGGGISGTGRPVVASGTVTGFGSIIVNGIEFDTSDATILFDSQRGSAAYCMKMKPSCGALPCPGWAGGVGPSAIACPHAR